VDDLAVDYRIAHVPPLNLAIFFSLAAQRRGLPARPHAGNLAPF
jgi:hypothetical protein